MDQLMRTATKIEQEMLQSIDEAFRNVIKPVLQKHKATLDQLDKLMQAGLAGRARKLWRTSGILEDLAEAIAGAGAVSADAIRDGIKRIRGAAHDTG